MSRSKKDGKESERESWWQVLPTVLKATAGIITGLVALLVALQQIGVFHRGPQENFSAQSRTGEPEKTPATENHAAKSQSPAGGTKQTEAFPKKLSAGLEAKADGVTYKILAATLDRHSDGKLDLRFKVRVLSGDSANAYLISDTFRLIVDEVPVAPESAPSQYVPAQSSAEGDVVFVIPENSA